MARLRTAALLPAVVLVLTACGQDGTEGDTGSVATPDPSLTATLPTPLPTRVPIPSPTGSPTEQPGTPEPTEAVARPGPVEPTDVTEVATDLQAPWALVPLADGSVLVSQRDTGTIVAVAPDGGVDEVGTVADVAPLSEGGLLGLALDPADDTRLFVYLTTEQDNRIITTTLGPDGLGPAEVLLDGIPRDATHNGGRLAFGPDGMLYASTGDAQDADSAQDPGALSGKILRLAPDGSVPPDNPDPDSPVWTLGHRNVQGLAFDDDGRLWASEFGANAWDELNLIEAGSNYGWPEVEGEGGEPDFVDPQVQWSTDEASPSGIAYVRDTLVMATLRGRRLWTIPVDADGAGEPADHLVEEYGRLRDAVTAPDGSVWVLTNNTDTRGEPREGDDRLLRLTMD